MGKKNCVLYFVTLVEKPERLIKTGLKPWGKKANFVLYIGRFIYRTFLF
jgi:hypothetical protein